MLGRSVEASKPAPSILDLLHAVAVLMLMPGLPPERLLDRSLAPCTRSMTSSSVCLGAPHALAAYIYQDLDSTWKACKTISEQSRRLP